jgi:protein tyrosine phosphatase
MVQQEQVRLIVMLCNLKENNKVQCEQYWPKAPGESLTFGSITVRMDSMEEMGPALIHRNFTVITEGEELKVT